MERLYDFLEITKVFALCIPIVESSGFIDLGAVFLFGFYIHIVSLLRVDLFAFKFTDGQLCGVLADRFYFFITFFRLCGDIHIISTCSADFSPLEAQAVFRRSSTDTLRFPAEAYSGSDFSQYDDRKISPVSLFPLHIFQGKEKLLILISFFLSEVCQTDARYFPPAALKESD